MNLLDLIDSKLPANFNTFVFCKERQNSFKLTFINKIIVKFFQLKFKTINPGKC
jgi:hypothetical protein